MPFGIGSAEKMQEYIFFHAEIVYEIFGYDLTQKRGELRLRLTTRALAQDMIAGLSSYIANYFSPTERPG